MNDNPYESPRDRSMTPPRPRGTRGGVLLGIGIAVVLLVLLLLPMQRNARGAAQRNSCLNNVKLILLALQNYHNVHGTFPPAYTVDPDGNRLHSWRTLVLPYLEQQELFEKIDLTKPWDDPLNAEARSTLVDCYQCPASSVEEGQTTYLAVVDPEAAMTGSAKTTFGDIIDGSNNTIMIVEVNAKRAVDWMAPMDLSIDEVMAGFGDPQTPHSGGVYLAGYADGHAGAVSVDIDRGKLRAMLTARGREILGDDQ